MPEQNNDQSYNYHAEYEAWQQRMVEQREEARREEMRVLYRTGLEPMPALNGLRRMK